MITKNKSNHSNDFFRDKRRKTSIYEQGRRDESGMAIANIDVVTKRCSIRIGRIKTTIVNPNVRPKVHLLLTSSGEDKRENNNYHKLAEKTSDKDTF